MSQSMRAGADLSPTLICETKNAPRDVSMTPFVAVKVPQPMPERPSFARSAANGSDASWTTSKPKTSEPPVTSNCVDASTTVGRFARRREPAVIRTDAAARARSACVRKTCPAPAEFGLPESRARKHHSEISRGFFAQPWRMSGISFSVRKSSSPRGPTRRLRTTPRSRSHHG